MESGLCSVQQDRFNCGVFVLLNLIKIAQGGKPTRSDITKTQVNLLRDQLMWKLMAYILPTNTDITNDDQILQIMEIGGMYFI